MGLPLSVLELDDYSRRGCLNAALDRSLGLSLRWRLRFLDPL